MAASRWIVALALALAVLDSPVAAESTRAPARTRQKRTAPATAPAAQPASQPGSTAAQSMYTTYFYTAAEAVIHGYQADTKVRLISLAQKATIWQGVVNAGETKLIPTGSGVFAFLSDKKASIFAGTPSSCTCVGYFVRDQNGSYVSDRFYAELPASTSDADSRVLLWAWQDTGYTITDVTADKVLYSGKLAAGKYLELDDAKASALSSHVLSIRGDRPALAMQVYYDEGFIVPSRDGRGVGREFLTYVGSITEGKNDLNFIAYQVDAAVTATDLKSGEKIWSGTVKAGTIKSLTLSKRYVRVTADREIATSVIPFDHYPGGGYAEHHYGVGLEGSGIDHEFLLPTPGEVWIFSYYDNTQVSVADARTGKQVWQGKLMAGHSQGLTPGFGLYRIKSSNGTSVMGGSSACGGDYSPAAGMFRVDEEVMRVAQQIIEERRQAAAALGQTLTAVEAAAPLTEEENRRVQKRVKAALGQSLNADEVQQRFEASQQQQ
ncbi:MAG: hypothetical protein JXR83_15610 [Deltaproteobacteria bacterium]|nr:hypothetical protein [Deltaproteobacteria bacterium]